MAHNHNHESSENIAIAFFLELILYYFRNIHHVTVEVDFLNENCKNIECDI